MAGDQSSSHTAPSSTHHPQTVEYEQISPIDLGLGITKELTIRYYHDTLVQYDMHCNSHDCIGIAIQCSKHIAHNMSAAEDKR